MTADPPSDDHEPGTVFMPGQGWQAPAGLPPPTPPVQPRAESVAPSPPGRVQEGSVLNGIYRIERFIARGGMGEVFEGVNINNDRDRVAIKVMLPNLVSDPKVREMFLEEVRTLMKISHPALVKYRVMARDPVLGVDYHACEFIEGEQLSECLGRSKPSSADLRRLIRRMAEGLRTAHELGVVHRDMSPDNIMLPHGDLSQAKIIDFGIAKNLGPGAGTIVGDGFAGKIGYVAPEQFGDFGRDVGPWTDIYSLGLVILSFAAGRHVDMGATLVDAVDRRRAGPDLSPIPEDLRPLIAAMVVADPARRLRSMDDVLRMLDGAPQSPEARAGETTRIPGPEPAVAKPAPAGGRILMIALAVGAITILLAGGAFLLIPKSPSPSPTPSLPASAAAPPAELVRQAIENALPHLACSWLDVERSIAEGGGVGVAMSGVAGDPAAAQSVVSQAVRTQGVNSPDISFTQVMPIGHGACAALEAFNAIRGVSSSGAKQIATSESVATLENGKRRVLITVNAPEKLDDIAIYAIDGAGNIDSLLTSRAAVEQRIQSHIRMGSKEASVDKDRGIYTIPVDLSPPFGMQGFMLLTGRGPFDTSLLAAAPAARGLEWKNRIAQAAAAGSWKAQMVWITVRAST